MNLFKIINHHIWFALLLLFLAAPSEAATCVYVSNNGTVKSDGVSVTDCNDLILVTKIEYESMNLNSVVTTLIDLFEFSVEDFAAFNAACLIGFISGHSIGRVTRLLGKA